MLNSYPRILGYSQSMTSAQVYVETSVPSFYHTTRTGAAAVARRDWTRRWWSMARERYMLVSSNPVLDELGRGDYPSKEAALGLARELQLLEISPPVAEIVEAYVRHRSCPRILQEMRFTSHWPRTTSVSFW